MSNVPEILIVAFQLTALAIAILAFIRLVRISFQTHYWFYVGLFVLAGWSGIWGCSTGPTLGSIAAVSFGALVLWAIRHKHLDHYFGLVARQQRLMGHNHEDANKEARPDSTG